MKIKFNPGIEGLTKEEFYYGKKKTYMKILGDRLLVSPLPVQERSSGGIVLPQGQAGDFMQWWKIESLGTGKTCADLAVGQTVLTETRTTHETLDDGRKIMGTDQIIAKLETIPDLA